MDGRSLAWMAVSAEALGSAVEPSTAKASCLEPYCCGICTEKDRRTPVLLRMFIVATGEGNTHCAARSWEAV